MIDCCVNILTTDIYLFLYDILWTLTFLSLTHFYDQVCTWNISTFSATLLSECFSWTSLITFSTSRFSSTVLRTPHFSPNVSNLHQPFFQPMSCRLRRLAGWAMNGLQHFLCGNFLGRFDDHHASPPVLRPKSCRRFFATVGNRWQSESPEVNEGFTWSSWENPTNLPIPFGKLT